MVVAILFQSAVGQNLVCRCSVPDIEGTKLSVLCSSNQEQLITDILLSHTTSLGIRKYEVEKTLLKRESYQLKTKYGEVTIKTAIYKGKKLKSKPEYEECIKIAREHGIPVQTIYQEINSLLKT